MHIAPELPIFTLGLILLIACLVAMASRCLKLPLQQGIGLVQF
jgi:hypothetical protein